MQMFESQTDKNMQKTQMKTFEKAKRIKQIKTKEFKTFKKAHLRLGDETTETKSA